MKLSTKFKTNIKYFSKLNLTQYKKSHRARPVMTRELGLHGLIGGQLH